MTSSNGNIFRGPLCRELINRSPVTSPHKGQWRGALMFSLICAWTNSWVNNRGTDDLRRHHAHYDVMVMGLWCQKQLSQAAISNYIPHFSMGCNYLSLKSHSCFFKLRNTLKILYLTLLLTLTTRPKAHKWRRDKKRGSGINNYR